MLKQKKRGVDTHHFYSRCKKTFFFGTDPTKRHLTKECLSHEESDYITTRFVLVYLLVICTQYLLTADLKKPTKNGNHYSVVFMSLHLFNMQLNGLLHINVRVWSIIYTSHILFNIYIDTL